MDKDIYPSTEEIPYDDQVRNAAGQFAELDPETTGQAFRKSAVKHTETGALQPETATFGVKVKGNIKEAAPIRKMSEAIRSRHGRTVFWQTVGEEVLLKAFQRNVEEGGGQTKYVPLKPDTVDYKEAIGAMYPSKPLMRFGDLYDSLFEGGPGNVLHATDKGVTAGSSHEHVHYAHKPGQATPVRPVIEITDEDVEKIKDLVHAFVVESLKPAGSRSFKGAAANVVNRWTQPG
jgi:hypothetical protein